MTVSYEHRVLFKHEGPLDMEVLPQIVRQFERLLADGGARPPVRRRILNTLIELTQNIIHYGVKDDQFPPYIGLSREGQHITLTTRNLVYYSQELFLHSYLQNLLQMSKEELEALHHSTLTTGSYSDSGGANLGFVQIISKADDFSYEISSANQNYSWFTVKVSFVI
ncbi:MAG: DUF6272 family protein [Bacteroidia bacterium]|nr:DUF6272 family protein [Bacteroidia bacterium]